MAGRSAAQQGNGLHRRRAPPARVNNLLHSARILADGCEKFRTFSVEGTELNRDRIAELVDRSLMLVTALSPVIGYDKASAIAHAALDQGTTHAAVDPQKMARPDGGNRAAARRA